MTKMTDLFLELNAYYINIRIPDEGRSPLKPMIFPHEISQGGSVMENDQVKVTAALVNHPPVTPAFAYRFDTKDRSIVFSGDTTPCDNLVKLAQGAEVLVHEVILKPSLAKMNTGVRSRTLHPICGERGKTKFQRRRSDRTFHREEDS